jgi:hypothetical protein
MTRNRFTLILVLASLTGVSAEEPPVIDLSTAEARGRSVQALKEQSERAKTEAVAEARRRNWPIRGEANGKTYELMELRNGRPRYYVTMNVNAAISTAANLVRNTAPYNANGTNWIAGVWDAGSVLTTHQEFGSRVNNMNGAASHYHSTHVGGTIGAAGVDANAHGMAPKVQIDSYDWNSDTAEMTSRAATGAGQTTKIYISNHSYGYISGWYGTTWYGTRGSVKTAVLANTVPQRSAWIRCITMPRITWPFGLPATIGMTALPPRGQSSPTPRIAARKPMIRRLILIPTAGT